MMFWIMLPSYLIILGIMNWAMKYYIRAEDGCIFCVRIPREHREDETIKKIIQEFLTKKKVMNIVMSIFVVGGYFLSEYDMISTVYSFVWIFVYLGLVQIALNKAFDRTYQYKKEQGITTKGYSISFDTEVARLKQSFLFPKWHWFIILAITLLGCYLWIPEEKENLVGLAMIGANVIIFATLFMLAMVIPKTKMKVFSINSDINVALCRIFYSKWTKAFAFCGYINAISWAISGLFPKKDESIAILVFFTTFETLLIFIVLLATAWEIRKERNMFGNMEQEAIEEMDEDIFWRGGIYNNPHDTKLWVEKRNGMGITMNMAKPAGKIITFLAYALVIGNLIWMITMIPIDFPSLSYEIVDGSICVDATGYDTKIVIDDVVKAEVVDSLPRRYRNNGYEGKQYSFGKYRVKEYGQCRLYIDHSIKKYLILYTDETTYIINSADENEFNECVDVFRKNGVLGQ